MKEKYKNAERLSKKIIEMCVEEGITLRELEMLKTALPIAIDRKIAEYFNNQKLQLVCSTFRNARHWQMSVSKFQEKRERIAIKKTG